MTALAVGEALRRALAERGWLQKQAAWVLETTPCLISDVSLGKRGIGVHMALKLEAALGIPAHRYRWLELQIADDIARADPVDAAAIEERAAMLVRREG